eukprot:2824194-Rhodomonas_salina.1
MSSFFRPEVAPLFQKPQNSRAAGQSAAGGVEGSANEVSGSVAASAAGAAGGEQETVMVVDDDGVDGGDAREDEDATESENETTDQPQSSTDTEHVPSTAAAYSVDPALEKELAGM